MRVARAICTAPIATGVDEGGASRRAREDDLLREAVGAISSASVFHSPQASHRPPHFG